jgi:mycothiol synthase
VDDELTLPQGFTTRPCAIGDAEAAYEVVAALELDLDGQVEVDPEDIVTDWSSPAVDLRFQSLAVLDAERIAAWALVKRGRAQVWVQPTSRGRGLGAALLTWTEDAARWQAWSDLFQITSDNDRAAASLLERHTYTKLGTAWILRTELTGPLPRTPPTLPSGYRFAEFSSDDEPGLYEVVETAFRDIPTQRAQTFEEWSSHILARSDFDPSLVTIVAHGHEPVGTAVGFILGDEGWVEQLAVARAHRRQGLGRSLLQESFRRFRERGLERAGLSTNSETGALGLYERAGLAIARSYTRRGKSL